MSLSQKPFVARATVLLAVLLAVCLYATTIGQQVAEATAINIWKHRYPLSGGWGYYPGWGYGAYGHRGGYGGGFGGGYGGIGLGK